MMMFVVCSILAFIRGHQAYYIAMTLAFVFGKLYTVLPAQFEIILPGAIPFQKSGTSLWPKHKLIAHFK